MNVDRSYLPYKSAREYQDRKMAKWMGFFLSEHTTALNTEANQIAFNQIMNVDEKLLLINQLYLQGFRAVFTLAKDKQVFNISGRISSVEASQIGIQTEEAHHFAAISEIITVKLEEEWDDGRETISPQ